MIEAFLSGAFGAFLALCAIAIVICVAELIQNWWFERIVFPLRRAQEQHYEVHRRCIERRKTGEAV